MKNNWTFPRTIRRPTIEHTQFAVWLFCSHTISLARSLAHSLVRLLFYSRSAHSLARSRYCILLLLLVGSTPLWKHLQSLCLAQLHGFAAQHCYNARPQKKIITMNIVCVYGVPQQTANNNNNSNKYEFNSILYFKVVCIANNEYRKMYIEILTANCWENRKKTKQTYASGVMAWASKHINSY